MKLGKTVRTLRAYLFLWAGVAATFGLIAAFPVATKAALLIACGTFLLYTSWKLVETYIDDI